MFRPYRIIIRLIKICKRKQVVYYMWKGVSCMLYVEGG
jgi:hypothetical protein